MCADQFLDDESSGCFFGETGADFVASGWRDFPELEPFVMVDYEFRKSMFSGAKDDCVLTLIDQDNEKRAVYACTDLCDKIRRQEAQESFDFENYVHVVMKKPPKITKKNGKYFIGSLLIMERSLFYTKYGLKKSHPQGTKATTPKASIRKVRHCMFSVSLE